MTIVEMQMNIDCDGCEDNVRKALLRLQGVHYVDVDRVRGKVTVTGTVTQKKVLRAARCTGRLAVLWPSAYDPEYAQPAYYHHHHQAKPAAHAQPQHHYYHSVQHSRNGGGGTSLAVVHGPAAQNGKASSYNYHVHGYYDSDLHGYYYHEQQALSSVVPVAARSYFSDDNPNACSVM